MAYPPTTTDRTNGQTIDASHINVLNDAVDDIVAELGTNPSDTETTVTARLATLDTTVAGKAATSHSHATTDITSGTLATARLGSGTANGSTFLRGDSTWAVPAGGTGYEPPYVVVAAVNSTATADYYCDGVNDEVQIQAAIDDATSAHAATDVYDDTPFPKGKVMLTGGQFVISSPILMKTGVHLQGQGRITELIADSCTATGTGYNGATGGARSALLKLYDRYTHYVEVSDMTLNGDYASGGACDAIYFASLAGNNTDMDGWPSSNPDPNVAIHGLVCRNFKGTGSRKTILISDDLRGTTIDRCQIKLGDVSGIEFLNAPDSHVSNVHLGDFNSYGYDSSTSGNIKFTNCKAFYCDVAGFRLGNRTVAAGCEAQDNAIGFYIGSEPSILSGVTVDSSSSAGIYIGSSGTSVVGAQIFNRSGGRYTTQTNGIQFAGTLSDTVLMADVSPVYGANTITNTYTGTLPTAANRNFIHLTGESTSNIYRVDPLIRTGTATINPASLAANTSVDQTFTLTGVATGDSVTVSPPASLNAGIIIGGVWVSATNTVTIRLHNLTGSAIDIASASWTYNWVNTNP